MFPLSHPSLQALLFSTLVLFPLSALGQPPPDLLYGTMYGGSGADEAVTLVNTINEDVCLVGRTDSEDLSLINPQQDVPAGAVDAFVMCFHSLSEGPVFITYYGGSETDLPQEAAYYDGALYVTGISSSPDLPGPTGGYQDEPDGNDCFIVKLDIETGEVLAKTMLGGDGLDSCQDIAVGKTGVWVAGLTRGSFPVVDALHDQQQGSSDSFLARLDHNLTTLQFSTRPGGEGTDNARAMALVEFPGETEALIFVTGISDAPGFPVTDGSEHVGDEDAFLSQYTFDPATGSVTYDFGSYIIAGSGRDRPNDMVVGPVLFESTPGISIDVESTLLLTGNTTSPGMETGGRAFNGNSDGFTLENVFSGRLGGPLIKDRTSFFYTGPPESSNSEATTVVKDALGNIVTAGNTFQINSTDGWVNVLRLQRNFGSIQSQISLPMNKHSDSTPPFNLQDPTADEYRLIENDEAVTVQKVVNSHLIPGNHMVLGSTQGLLPSTPDAIDAPVGDDWNIFLQEWQGPFSFIHLINLTSDVREISSNGFSTPLLIAPRESVPWIPLFNKSSYTFTDDTGQDFSFDLTTQQDQIVQSVFIRDNEITPGPVRSLTDLEVDSETGYFTLFNSSNETVSIVSNGEIVLESLPPGEIETFEIADHRQFYLTYYDGGAAILYGFEPSSARPNLNRSNYLRNILTGAVVEESSTEKIHQDLELIAFDGLGLPVVFLTSPGATEEVNHVRGFNLEPAYPNPFQDATHIEYTLPTPATVHLTVYDLLGRKVRRLVQSIRPAGSHTVSWDGRDESGNRAADGTYFLRLETDRLVLTRNVTLLNTN